MSSNKNSDSMEARVVEWLSHEGYPLEFFTANCFYASDFRVFQGYYVGDEEHDTVREIDVLAHKNRSVEDGLIRVNYVVECKYTKDKPWAVFISRHSNIAPQACISQTIGSELGQTLLWLVADNQNIQHTSMFSAPATPGFSGRQAFSKDNDIFFAAMQSVASKALSLAKRYDRSINGKNKMPKYASIVLPVIVIDGELLEILYNEASDSIEAQSAKMLRLHWRGSEAWRLHTTVDIVKKDHLSTYVSRLKSEMPIILDALESGYRTIAECFRRGDLEPLSAIAAISGFAGRGIADIPSMLQPLSRRRKEKPGQNGT